MGLITFDERDDDRLVAKHYSTGRGPVLRSDMMELNLVAPNYEKSGDLK